MAQFYCRAEAALGTGGSPLSYTAWVMYPAIHELRQAFPEVTAGYARLSLQLIWEHPWPYLINVWHSFADFWTDRISMVSGLYQGGDRGYPLARMVMQRVLPIERLLRDATAAAFVFAICAGVRGRKRMDPEARLFCAVTAWIVLGSAILQALVEFGPENARLETPTEPLLLLTVLVITGELRARRRLLF